jgi:site-specific recombinase XerD
MALRRYLRERASHKQADLDALWLGKRGGISAMTVYRIVSDRAQQAGLSVHPHQLRHTFSHEFRASGGELDDLCYLTGWKSMNMALRYGASAAGERAERSARQRSLGDRI